jgi:hypothetical protein
MPQHDLNIANDSGAAFRLDLNNALVALGTSMRGPNAPPAPAAGMVWVEDDNPSTTRWTVRMYDGADWIALGILDTTANVFEVAQTQIAGSTVTGRALLSAADAAAARSTAGAEPVATNSAVPGKVDSLIFADGANAVLPAGGTWHWDLFRLVSATGGIDASNSPSGVSAGGTTVGTGAAGFQYMLKVKRVS